MTEIKPGRDVVTLINVFTPKPGKTDEFIAAQTAEYERLAGKVPGSLTINLHKSLDGTRVVNYAQFASVAEYEAWRASDLFRDHFERIKALVEDAAPNLYEVVYTKDLRG